jgi:hypothetical protein
MPTHIKIKVDNLIVRAELFDTACAKRIRVRCASSRAPFQSARRED